MNAAKAPTDFDDVAPSTPASRGVRSQLLGMTIAAAIAGNLTAGLVRADDSALAEVVVTAQRRSENVQDVPASITVFTSKQISDLRIEQTTDLAAYTPG